MCSGQWVMWNVCTMLWGWMRSSWIDHTRPNSSFSIYPVHPRRNTESNTVSFPLFQLFAYHNPYIWSYFCKIDFYRAVHFRLFREPDIQNWKYSDTWVPVTNFVKVYKYSQMHKITHTNTSFSCFIESQEMWTYCNNVPYSVLKNDSLASPHSPHTYKKNSCVPHSHLFNNGEQLAQIPTHDTGATAVNSKQTTYIKQKLASLWKAVGEQ